MKSSCRSLVAACLALGILILVPTVVFAAAAPSITTQPQSQSVLVGSNAVFTVVAGGQTPLYYQWSFNGSNLANSTHIGGATNATLTISNTVAGDTGNYQVVVSNSHGNAASSNAMLALLFPPDITNQPTNQVVLLSSTAIFSVIGTGTEPLLYQWRKNGTNLLNGERIKGVTTPTLTISNIQMSDVGDYQLILSNAYGVSASSAVSLSVIPVLVRGYSSFLTNMPYDLTNATAIAAGIDYNMGLKSGGSVVVWGITSYGQTNLPSGLSNVVAVAAGRSQSLALNANGTVVAWGDDTLGQTDVPSGASNVVAIASGVYHSLALKSDGTVVGWGYNGYGQTSTPSGLSNVIAIAAGGYHSLALKSDGSVVGWGKHDAGQTNVPPGLSNVVAVAACGNQSVALKSNGKVVAWGDNSFGQTNVPPGLSNVMAIAIGTTHGVALKVDGTVSAWGDNSYYGEFIIPNNSDHIVAISAGYYCSLALVENPTVQIPPSIWWQPTNYMSSAGQTVELNPYMMGSLPLNFQWFFNGVLMPGETNKWLVLNSIRQDQIGNYQFVVTNSYGCVTGQIALFKIPTIVTQPTNQSVLSGTNAVFTAGVIGTTPLAYQWRKDGAPLSDNGTCSGSASPTLTISNCQPNLAGSYDLVITNSYGSTTSQVAVLYVHGEPRIVTAPANQYVLPGGNARFNVSAAGIAPLDYQWCFNGAPLTDNGHFTGAATSALSISNVTTNDTGAFTVIITNNWGAITSSASLFIAAARYVNVKNSSPSPPYTNWATAANVIQTAIDAANVGDWIIVTNGSYFSGGRVVGANDKKWNRVVMTNQVTVTSVNGPFVTTILGEVSANYHPYGGRCVWLGSGSTLSGFTVAEGGIYNGAFSQSGFDTAGGGILGAGPGSLVTGCIITGNSFCLYGGGVDNATLNNCLVTGNNAYDIGGGAYNCTLVNCTVVGNSDDLGGGGTAYSTCENCVVYNNPGSGPSQSNYLSTSFVNSCTTPDPGGVGNTTNDPVFLAGHNYILQSNSPCIDTGSNAFVTTSTDLAGLPRILNGVVDMGANEYQHAPWFLVSPANNLTVLAGSNFVLKATALGDSPAYQWWFNGAPLADGGRILGSASNVLTVALSQTNDSGSYWVTASNSFGMATSTVASVIVLLPVAITDQPTNQTRLTGFTATFTVGATGFAPPAYRWYSNGVPLANGARISGATSTTLSIFNVQTNDSGTAFQAVITNNYGAVTSQMATLTVLAPAQITGQPMSQAVLLGSNATFTVTADGSPPMIYQWYSNGVPLADGGRISGSTTPALTISNVGSGDAAGGYFVVVTNSVNVVISWMAWLTPQSVLAPSVRYVALTCTNPSLPYLDWTTAATNIQDAIDAAVVGDLVFVTNGIYSMGGRVVFGKETNRVALAKVITLLSVNGPQVTRIVGGTQTRGAYVGSNAILSGFTITNGQAKYLSSGDQNDNSGGGVWCETSGLVTNCVIISNTASQYGGGVYGGKIYNCSILTNLGGYGGGGARASVLYNCGLRGNASPYGYEGGASSSILSNCVLTANYAHDGGGGMGSSTAYNSTLVGNSTDYGFGAASGSILYNCVLAGNIGGAESCSLFNCTVAGNYKTNGGIEFGGYGVQYCSVRNSVIYYNSSTPDSYNWDTTSTLVNCCTVPLPGGAGNFTNAPNFVNAAIGNYRLQSNSPCINAGNNLYATNSADLDGNPRIVGGSVDIGAYEYQTPGSALSYVWAQQYGLPTDGTADYADADGDGMNNWQEWIAGLNPTNPASVLTMRPLFATNNSNGITVRWQSVNTRTYYLQRATNLAAQPAFSSIQSNISGLSGTTSFKDTSATNGGPYYYRVGVQ